MRSFTTHEPALERETRIYEKLMRTYTQYAANVLNVLRDDNYTALVTEFADGGDLEHYVAHQGRNHGLAPAEAKQIGLYIAQALAEFHEHEIVHRDLKPRNILSFGDSWKLTDFGLSKNLSRLMTLQTFQARGTPGYTAPEQFQGVSAQPSADIFSLGKILVFLLTNQTDVDFVTFPVWSELIKPCIHRDPDERPDINTIIDQLEKIKT